LFLIAASAAAFLWRGGTPRLRVQRSIVSGRVTGIMKDKPWAGAVIQLGPERQILTAGGAFDFALVPGLYALSVCCSTRFQAVGRQVTVGNADMRLDVELTPLTTVAGLLNIRRGTQAPLGFQISAALDGTNVVDRVMTDAEGRFVFHLSEGKWSLALDNLPKGYTVASVTLDGVRLRGMTLDVPPGDGTAKPMPLQIVLR
jgi:hypothetical protein